MSSKGCLVYGFWYHSNHCYSSLPILLHVIHIQSVIAKQQMTDPL